MSSIAIRDANLVDAGNTSRFLVRVWHSTYDQRHGAAKVDAITARWHNVGQLRADMGIEGAIFLLAEAEDEIVGHAFATREADGRGKLSRLYVDADRQGQGVGGALLAEVEARLSGLCRSLWLEVDVLGEEAIAFYRRKGYVEVGPDTKLRRQQHRHTRPGHGAASSMRACGVSRLAEPGPRLCQSPQAQGRVGFLPCLGWYYSVPLRGNGAGAGVCGCIRCV